MQYADRRDLRQRMYEAYMSRSSAPPFDNRPLLADILALRRELAAIHGYPTFADYRLAEHMVTSGDAVQGFQDDLYRQTLPYWQREIETLTRFARESLGIGKLEPWDTAYATEKLRRARFDFDEEELRPYFPLEQVLSGMFGVAQRLFGVRVSPRDDAEAWHPDVRVYDLHDEAGTHLGSFYADWFPREDKRAGAWMNRFITGGPTEDGGFAPHLALMCANFTRPQAGKPALLTHREVQTTFHEFGHLLHHCLSRVPVRERAGAHVAWDFVELPSQIMENWTYEREALDLFARHVDTGAPIPEPLFRKMQRARTFMAASQQMRQLSFGAVDLALHTAYGPEEGDVIPYGNRVMERFVMRPEFAHNAFLAAFSHIFAGGYAAAYYSYKWSEMLEADAFTRFQREGIFNPETGRAFRDTILARGDSADPGELYRAFMGRDPDASALIARNLGPLPVGAS
jgi:oligopeptidase A